MSDRFTLRFVLAQGRPTFEEVAPLWDEEAGWTTTRDDGVLVLHHGGRVAARLDLLTTDEARGRAVLSALGSATARLSDEPEVIEAVDFVLGASSGVVLARPEAADEAELEASLSALDVLWEHLFEAHGGLLQIDGEGIYDDEGPLVEEP